MLAAACLVAGAACPALAAAWGPPRSNGLGTGTLRGGSGADYLRGAEGPDVVRGNGGGDLLTGDTGPDRVYGAGASDTLTGGAGNDLLSGGSGNDIAFGGFGADRIAGGSGDDALDGNNDNDALSGGAGNDVLHGGSGIDTLHGGSGSDRIFADSGSDTISAGPGDDTVVVGGQTKAIVGCGPGRDTLYLTVDAEATSDYAGRGIQKGYKHDCETIWITDALHDPNKGVTYLAPDAGGSRRGTGRDDTLLGGPGPDALHGSRGNDVLWGLRQPDVKSAAPDVLDAGAGDDTVYGGPGPQRIDGGPGDDFLEGGVGNGTIAGGSGDDTIRLRGGGLTKIDAGSGNDTIYARGTGRAQIACGRGRDVATVDAGDRAARDCERVVGRAARSAARPRATYADAVSSTPGLRYWWRLGERAPLGSFTTLVDRVTGATGSHYGRLGVPGVVDDGDTAYESDTAYFGNTYLTLGFSNAVFRDEFTFEAWYRPNGANSKRALFNDEQGDGREGIALLREVDGALRAVIVSSSDARAVDVRTGPLNLVPGSWHHIALTRSDDSIAIYVDGIARVQAPATPVTFGETSYSIGVGARVNEYSGWEGGIDEVSVYDRPLDAATVDGHFRAGDDGLAPVARADPPLTGAQPRSGVIRLTTGKAGASFRCSLDGAGFAGCTPEYALQGIADGPHELRVLATSRTGIAQVTPTVLRFSVDARVPGTVAALRLAPDADGRAIVTFGSSGASRFECRNIGGLSLTPVPFTPCRAPMDVAPLTNLEVRAVDASGNADPTAAFVQAPAAGKGFAFGPTLPTFAGARAEARLSGEYADTPNYQCKVDAREWAACSGALRLPILEPGAHAMQVRQHYGSPPVTATTPPMTWTVAPRPGDVAIAGLQMQLVIERSARLLRRAPRVRFALSHPAATTVDVLGRGRKPVIRVSLKGATGPNLVKIGARRLNGLREGRYTVRVTARGATGRTTVQQLPLAIVPPLR